MSYVEVEEKPIELNADGKPLPIELTKPDKIVPDLKFEINLDALEIDDLEILDASKPGVKARDILDVLDRLVVGGVRGKGYKFTAMKALGQAVFAAVNEATNPKN